MHLHRLALLVTLGAALAFSACGGGGGTAPAANGDAAHGHALFNAKCSSCHGERGSGGIGPRLAGASITLDAARATIDEGASGMPAGLVTGQDEDDVLAYLGTILSP